MKIIIFLGKKILTPAAIFCLVFAAIFFIGKNLVLAADKPFVPLNPLANLQVKIPGLDTSSAATCTTIEGNTECTLPWLAIYIKGIYNYSMGILGILAALAVMIGGVIWIVASGNASRITEAKAWIGGGITGLILGLTSYMLLNEINPEIIGLQSIQLSIVKEEILPDTGLAVTIPSNLAPSLDPSTWKPIPSDPNICPTNDTANQGIIDKIMAAAKCMGNKGLKIKLSGGARSITYQAKIYDTRYNHQPNKCGTLIPPNAPACCPYPLGVKICPHTSGSALDLIAVSSCNETTHKLTNQYILQDCMQAAGAYLLSLECWHFEYPQISVSATKSQVGNHNNNYCTSWPQ